VSTARIVFAGVLTFGLGVGSGWLGAKAGQPPPAATGKSDAPESAALEGQLVALQRSNAFLIAKLASLATQARVEAPAPSPALAPTEAVPQTAQKKAQPEELAPEVDQVVADKALLDGKALLARVIQAGQWSEQERRAWQDVLAAAGRDGTRELLVARSLAINEGKIRPVPQ